MDFQGILPEPFKNYDNSNETVRGNLKFDIFYRFFVASIYAIPLAYFRLVKLDKRISLDNHSAYRKRLNTLVNWCLVDKIVQPFCSCCGIRHPINSIEELLVVSRLTGSWYVLRLKIAQVTHSLSFVLIYNLLEFYWNWRAHEFFSQ